MFQSTGPKPQYYTTFNDRKVIYECFEVFDPGKSFQRSLMFVGRARSLLKSGASRLESLGSDKHSSLS